MSTNQIIFCGYAILIVVMSLYSIILYAIDKKLAIKQKERIKEKTLLFSGVFFGALGSLIGRILAHHKTDKVYFSIVIIFSLIMQAISLVATFYFAFI